MQKSKGFALIMVGSKGHLGSSGEIAEQEQFGARVLHELGLMSEKEGRDMRRSHGVRPCSKTLLFLLLLLPASPSGLLMSSESGLGLWAPGTADGQ